MKILVTGLCLSRNLGGPAMGLTLVQELKKRLGDDLDFTFAIDPMSYQMEKHWAQYYGVKIVRRDSILSWTVTNNFILKNLRKYLRIRKQKSIFGIKYYKDIHEEFMNSFIDTDIVIDMMGIAYVGDGVRGYAEGINSYTNFYYAKKHNKPYVRFIQSFGPFNDWQVRFFAKREFNQLPFIPARGKNSAEYCKNIVKDKSKVYDFPDIAILLQGNYTWATKYLEKYSLQKKQFVILSPSAVIYNAINKNVGGSVGQKHITFFVKLSKYLIKRGEKILFLPHMYSDNINESDREIARKISVQLPKNNYFIVEDDIDPMQAKALISYSKYSIVSRYHALVAALSTGTNVISVGWNIKYQDIMEYYNMEKNVLDMRKYNPEVLTSKVVSLIGEMKEDDFNNKYEYYQDRAEKKVLDAFDILLEWINNEQK